MMYSKRKHPWYSAWHNFLARQRQTGCEVDMTFEEFVEWWETTGKWVNRGNRRENYCMSRVNKSHPYTTDNIRCIKIKDRRK